MKTSTMIFIGVMVAVLLLGTYFITKANKPDVITTGPGAAEPTANIWSVVGGIMDIFKKDDSPDPVPEADSFGEPDGTFGPPQY